jgi:hypothetical protein
MSENVMCHFFICTSDRHNMCQIVLQLWDAGCTFCPKRVLWRKRQVFSQKPVRVWRMCICDIRECGYPRRELTRWWRASRIGNQSIENASAKELDRCLDRHCTSWIGSGSVSAGDRTDS